MLKNISLLINCIGKYIACPIFNKRLYNGHLSIRTIDECLCLSINSNEHTLEFLLGMNKENPTLINN